MVQQFTTNLTLEEVLEAQDRADLTINTTFRLIDIILFGSAIDKRNTPPGSPVAYTPYIVGDTPTGDWATFTENSLAFWDGVAWLTTATLGRGTMSYDEALNEHFVNGDTGRGALMHRSWVFQKGTVSAGFGHYVGVAANHAMTIDSLTLVSGAATTSSGSDDWEFQLVNSTTTNSLFATAPNTFAAMGDFASNVAITLIPDQNQTMAAGDVMSLLVTLTGAPGNLTTFHVQVDGHLNV